MNAESFITIHNLCKHFGRSRLPAALDNINAQFIRGEMVAIAGPDGAGKTTLMRLLAALLTPTNGSITLAGFDTVKDAEEIHQIIGYMPQKFGLYEDLTVQQNLNLYADLRKVPKVEQKETFESLLKFTSLFPFTNRLAKDLSGGMKQKLGLACALIKKPQILILDEPSVGVDPISRRDLWDLVKSLLQDQITVIWSTSYLSEAALCDTVLLLNEGKLIYHGNPKAFCEMHNDQDLDESRKNTPITFEEAFIKRLQKKQDLKASPQLDKRKPNTPYVVHANHLTKHFGNFIAADRISFKIRQGEIFGLLGPNGAGKSTTFKMLCGLLKPTSGTAMVNGLNLQTAASEARAQIGYMAQKFSLYGTLSVYQNLQFFSQVYNLKGHQKQQKIEEMIDTFYLHAYLNEDTDKIPVGFKQRLSLASAIMHSPKVLFLDEPTSGVDPLTRQEFWHRIKALSQQGVTVLITTHFMDEAEYCDRIAILYESKVIDIKSPEGLKASAKTDENLHPTLEDAFIHLIKKQDKIKQ